MNERKYFDNIFQMYRTIKLEDFEMMENKINDFISFVRAKKLSPIEEIMVVYDRVKLLEGVNDVNIQSRQLSGVLKCGKAVCAGYTNLFNEILLRMGYKCCAMESYIDGVSHMYSIVEINDMKYDIHGIYNFDPTFDSLGKSVADRTISYTFFCKSFEEFEHLKLTRIPRGISRALQKDIDKSDDEVLGEIPTRTMNIVNGFFPSKENESVLLQIYKEGKDRNTWPKVNLKYLNQICELGARFRKSKSVDFTKIEQIIRNVRQNDLNSSFELEKIIKEINTFNRSQFKLYYDNPSIFFKDIFDNYVVKDNYVCILEKISNILKNKGSDEELKILIEIPVVYDQGVNFRIEMNNNGENKVVLQYKFDCNYDFFNKFLNPMIGNCLGVVSYLDSELKKPKYFNVNIRDYVLNFCDGNSLEISNANLDYLLSVDSFARNFAQNKKSKR